MNAFKCERIIRESSLMSQLRIVKAVFLEKVTLKKYCGEIGARKVVYKLFQSCQIIILNLYSRFCEYNNDNENIE